jgi:hypothetical protein
LSEGSRARARVRVRVGVRVGVEVLEGRHALVDEGHDLLLAQLLARLGHNVYARGISPDQGES